METIIPNLLLKHSIRETEKINEVTNYFFDILFKQMSEIIIKQT